MKESYNTHINFHTTRVLWENTEIKSNEQPFHRR